MSSQPNITQLLSEAHGGNRAALDRLLPLVYGELRRIAERSLRHENPNHTLQPTALVNEAYLRLVDQHSVDWTNRAQFFGLASEMMRRILVSYAQARHANKRGCYATRLALDDAVSFYEKPDLDLLLLDEALNRLAVVDPRQSRIVELRFFGGLSIEETADVMKISPATVKREWRVAKAWLYDQVGSRKAEGGN